MRQLVDRALSLEHAFGAQAGAALAAEVAAQADVTGRIAAIESFLRRREPAADLARESATRIVGEMLHAPPGTRVAELASRHGLSNRALQRLFGRYIGVSPKWVLRRYRLHEASERIASREFEDFSTLALDLGYADQAHFNRDFRSLLGVSPAVYARACAAPAI
jgi:AraC-like DNA-binding protein